MKRKKGSAARWLMAVMVVLLIAAGVCLALDGVEEPEPQMAIRPENRFEETIVVVGDSDYQPYSFYDQKGEPAGYDIELIYLLADAMQKNVDIRLMQWADAKAAVQNGEADVLMGQDYNMEALRDYELSMPLDNDPFVAFGQQKLISIDEFYGKKIATLKDSGSFSAFLTPYQLEGHTRTYETYGEAFQSVENKENDYAIAMYSVGRRAIANMKGSEMKAVGPVLAGNYLCIATKKGDTALIKELNSSIIALKRDGKIDELGNKWLGRYIEVISIRDFLEKNFTVLVLLLVFLLLLAAFIVIAVKQRQARHALMQHKMTKKVLEYQILLTETTKSLYENIYELDITHNCAGNSSTRQYFESLGIPGSTPYDEALETIARKRIREEYIQSYIDTFSPEHVMQAYRDGQDRLCCEFMITRGDDTYYWMRITARIFYWPEDASIHMITYRQNIDDEKKKELELEKKARMDALTGLYNKMTMRELVRAQLEQAPDEPYVFLMLDIDDFKNVNDNLGHSFGDYVITEFAKGLKNSSGGDIVGRIGGDEFAVFMPYKSREWLEEKAVEIIGGMCKEISVDDKCCSVSSSMGIALSPKDGTDFEVLYCKADAALYQTKKRGKNGYTFYQVMEQPKEEL